MPESTVQQRFVPGAPPPQAQQKSQRKKRRARKDDDDNAKDAPNVPVPTENAPEHVDVPQGTPAANTTREGSAVPEDETKHNFLLDFLMKRKRLTSKKIIRCQNYASTDPEKLDDDQRRTIKQLGEHQAVLKEITSLQSAIESHEAESARETAAKRVEAERAEKARTQEAVAAAKSALILEAANILSLLRLRSSLANDEINTASLSIQDEEVTAIYSMADALLGQDNDVKQAALATFLLHEGDWQGVSPARLIEITNAALNPPKEPTPEPESDPKPEPEPEEQSFPVEEVPTTVSTTAPSEPEALAPVSGVSGAIATSNSFRFMQDSELEGPFDETPANVPQETVAAQEPTEVAPVNGHTEEAAAPAAEVAAPIDWAAEEAAEELPSIAGLHAEFGTSGSATPAEHAAPANGEVPAPAQSAPSQDEDGFTQAGRGHRGDGRGRGRGGYRGDRGGFRGGGFRGQGDRGNYRGRGGDRGRGGGGYRSRGDGERRGGGRGRGRGDHEGPRQGDHGGFRQGDHGGFRQGGTSSPAPPTPAPAA